MTLLESKGGFLSLLVPSNEIDERRRLEAADREFLESVSARYSGLAERRASDSSAYLDIGRELYGWLNGAERWLERLRTRLVPPLELEIRGPWTPVAIDWAVLLAPWELLADETGFLASDAALRFAPFRRLGEPRAVPTLDSYRLGVTFMASSPRETRVLDFEAEEQAILTSAGQRGVDLHIDDSGDPEQLGVFLNELAQPIPVLHLSCHGHNAWRRVPDEPSRSVLLMEDEAGRQRPTAAAELIEALQPYEPRLLFLSACLTAAAGRSDPSRDADAADALRPDTVAHSLSTQLVSAGLPAVLGWDGSVSDRAATLFAHMLYGSLSRPNQTLPAAVAAARRRLVEGDPSTTPDPGDDHTKDSSKPSPLAASTEDRARSWHLARLWVGPEGGGPIVGGTEKRTLLPPDHGFKQLLGRKQHAQLEVADPAMFVGRRRPLQDGLRTLRESQHSGVLIHGMGRLGKSSLAARIANRRRDLKLAIVFGDYDALSILDALEDALKDHPRARDMLEQGRGRVRQDELQLEGVLIDLLSDPCKQAPDGQPVLLLIDDLERVLEDNAAAGSRRSVRLEEQAALAAVLRAFAPERSESRVMLTSRYRFTLPSQGHDLAERLFELPLASFDEREQQKLTLRQITAAQAPFASSPSVQGSHAQGVAEATVLSRLPLVELSQKVSSGNPGLQDLLQGKLALNPAVPEERVHALLSQMEEYLVGGDLPEEEEVREFLQRLAIDELLVQAGQAGKDLLRAGTLFNIPVPGAIFELLSEQLGGDVGHLLDLGLVDVLAGLADSTHKSISVNPLAAGRVEDLSEDEQQRVAEWALPALFDAWAATSGGVSRPPAWDAELFHLGLIARSAQVVAFSGANALREMSRDDDAATRAAGAEHALALLDAAGVEPSLELCAECASAFAENGEGTKADEALALGVAPTIVGSAPLAVNSGELSALSRFLFILGDRQQTSGEVDAAEATFRRLVEVEEKRENPHQRAVAMGQIADILEARGELDEALRIRREEELPVYEGLGDVRSRAVTMGKIADILAARGELDEALRIRREEQLPVYERLGDVRSRAVTMGKIADILVARGELDEALRIRREEQLPVYERLGDVRSRAIAMGKIADILAARGELDEALRIRREEELPVYEGLGDVRSRAVAMGQVADILEARGELDEALRIRREEELPVYERLGDVRSRAVTMGQVADILVARGELDEALRIRREEELPVYERLGDVRSRAVTMGQVADILEARGELDEALRIRREEELPVYEGLGDVRSRAIAMGKIADILAARGELDEALRIRREEQLPVYERLGDVRSRAIAMGKIADILVARGELDEALRIRREEELPVYEGLGDVRSRAVTMGQVADILAARGELDEALRIRREEELPVYERLGDVRSRAIAMGKVADILVARGELDEALRIRREEELPVYEGLGDVRSRAIAMGKIADILVARGELDEALRIRREEELPVYEGLGDVRSRAIAMGKIADILVARGELDEALRIRREEELPVYEGLGDVRSRAVTIGQVADILRARGELDEALRIRREEELPVYEGLGDVRSLLVARTNLALTLLQRGRPEDDGQEIRELLAAALRDARHLELTEERQIQDIIRGLNMDPDAPPFS